MQQAKPIQEWAFGSLTAITAFGVATHRPQLKARPQLVHSAAHSAARSVAKALVHQTKGPRQVKPQTWLHPCTEDGGQGTAADHGTPGTVDRESTSNEK